MKRLRNNTRERIIAYPKEQDRPSHRDMGFGIRFDESDMYIYVLKLVCNFLHGSDDFYLVSRVSPSIAVDSPAPPREPFQKYPIPRQSLLLSRPISVADSSTASQECRP